MAILFTALFSLVTVVQQVSTSVGVEPNYMCKIAKIESNWNPKAVNKATKAKGLYQVTRPTEEALKRRYKLSGDVFSPKLNTKLAALLTKEHSNYLKRKGLLVTYRNLYILHFFGIPSGYRFLTTSDETVVKDKFQKEYQHNRRLIGDRTVGQLKQIFQNKLNKAKNCNELI